ncbi:MAG: LamG domain-containing protein [Candidatus Muirbacterium halophilum]|nr:LamG domain-containing protein [Candidatus Muirbacterium halophilum]
MSQLRNNINTTPVVTRGLVGQYDVLYNYGTGYWYDGIIGSIHNKYPPYLINATSDYLETNPKDLDSFLAITKYSTYNSATLTASLINENKGAYIRLPGDGANDRFGLILRKYHYGMLTYENVYQSFFGNTITIQMTLTFEDLTNNKGIYGFHNPGIIAQYVGGNIEFGYYPAGSPYAISVPATTYFGANRIMNIAHTLTPKPGNQKHINRLYINGKQYGVDQEINYISTFSTGNNLIFGTSYNATNRFMTGNIYNILLYNTALTSDEVYQNYLIDKFRFGITHLAN